MSGMNQSNYVCTYGNFPEREEMVRKSLEDRCYYLHAQARYPEALGKIRPGDQLLLNAWGCILATGIAQSQVEDLNNDTWRYRVRVDEWKQYDDANPFRGYPSYGIRNATLMGGQFSLVKKVRTSWAVQQLGEMNLISEHGVMRQYCFQLGLADVASWHYPEIINNTCVEAGIPILQRGLVWTAQQDELLWDSLMRKIPIGALVLCPAIKGQARGDVCTHHIIDGQQRCNAIAEGFDGDPFVERDVERSNKRVLWLDLKPSADKLQNTSRRFLLRVTTSAHPWGYRVTDASGVEARLSCEEIRDALEQIAVGGKESSRPHTSEMSPYYANLPIPLGYLTRAFLDLEDCNEDQQSKFWTNVRNRVEKSNFPFPTLKQRLLEFIESKTDEDVALRQKAYAGVKNALEYIVVAVTAPDEISEGSDNFDGCDSIEHMFTRINRQGTRLEGEELIYSTIKSYWPEIQNGIDAVAKHRMPPSRMLRLALQVSESNRIRQYKGGVSLKEVRQIAGDTTERGKAARGLICADNSGQSKLCYLCETVDGWLDRKDNIGLPRVLKTAVANQAPELYVLLLLLAYSNNSFPREFIVALTLYLYFFDYRRRNSRRPSVIKQVLEACYKDGFSQKVIVDAVKSCQSRDSNDPWLLLPVNLEMITDALVRCAFDCNQLQGKEYWWDCFARFRCSRDMLLFWEADYLERVFPEYDPARKDLWAECNRPWDYDHVVPQDVVNKWADQGVNNWWLWCMGNMAAIPLAENRSKGNHSNWNYYDTNKELEIKDLKSFVSGEVDVVDFRRRVWERFLLIYNHLYTTIMKGLGVAFCESHS